MESALHPYSRLITVEYGRTPWPGETLIVDFFIPETWYEIKVDIALPAEWARQKN